MGTIQHHVVVATTYKGLEAERIQRWMDDLRPAERVLFARGFSIMEHFVTFVMMPDGSKEGGCKSDDGDKLRARFIKRLKDAECNYVELTYGELGCRV